MLTFCIGISHANQQLTDSLKANTKSDTSHDTNEFQNSIEPFEQTSDNPTIEDTKDSKLANGQSVEDHVKEVNKIADKHYEEFLLKAEKMAGDKAHIDKKTGFIDDAADASSSITTKKNVITNVNDRPQVDHYYDNDYSENLGDVYAPTDNDLGLDVNDKDYKEKLNDGYLLKQITTVGLIGKEKSSIIKCLKMKKYGRGTWQTFCQPVKKPKVCSDSDWKKLSTMALMYC